MEGEGETKWRPYVLLTAQVREGVVVWRDKIYILSCYYVYFCFYYVYFCFYYAYFCSYYFFLFTFQNYKK